MKRGQNPVVKWVLPLAVAVIPIGALAAVLFMAYRESVHMSGGTQRYWRTVSRLRVLVSALERYRIDVGSYPAFLDQISPSYVRKWPESARNPGFTDGWDHPIKYDCARVRAAIPYSLWSVGPNGLDESGEGDDVAAWKVVETLKQDVGGDGDTFQK